MAAPNAASIANPAFRRALIEAIDSQINELVVWPTIHDLLPEPPKFRKAREVSARRAAKLRKRGEYCHFVRWTVNGKCRYLWSGKVPDMFTFKFPRRPAASEGSGV